MYVRTLDERVLHFGHSGLLKSESFVFYDKQTDSHWVSATGRCIAGPYRGRTLDTMPVTQTTWAQWRAMHPETKLLEKPLRRTKKYLVDGYAPYYRESGSTFGLAVFLPEAQKFYALELLEPVVLDAIGGTPVAIVFQRRTKTALAWDPVIDGVARELRATPTADDADIELSFDGDARRWSGLTGERLDGIGPALKRIRTSEFLTQLWSTHYPNGEVYSRSADSEDAQR